jgi:hypothetical protein
MSDQQAPEKKPPEMVLTIDVPDELLHAVKRVAYALEWIASAQHTQAGFEVDYVYDCEACGCTLVTAGDTACPGCGGPVKEGSR